MKTKLINPFFFVIQLPMPMRPLLGRLDRYLLPFLDIFRNRKGRQRLAGISFDSNNLSMIGLSSSKILSLTSLPTGGNSSRFTKVLVSPTFSVIPSTLIRLPLSPSTQLAFTGIFARMR
jgi:hypothetical protein